MVKLRVFVQTASGKSIRRVDKEDSICSMSVVPNEFDSIPANKRNVLPCVKNCFNPLSESVWVPSRRDSSAVLALLQKARTGRENSAPLNAISENSRKGALKNGSWLFC